MKVQTIDIRYGQGVLTQLGNLNCQYIIYQLTNEPNRNKSIEYVRYNICCFNIL